MPRLPSLRQWDQLTKRECQRIANHVATLLPETFDFKALQQHRCGQQRRWVAKYLCENETFSLILGGRVTLGASPREVVIPENMVRDFEETRQVDEWSHLPTLKQLMRQSLSAKRTIYLRPYLLEAEPIFVAREAVPRSTRKAKRSEWRLRDLTHRQLKAELASEGFRLPTSDEWEHACGAGSRSIFRWGDEFPPGQPSGRDAPSFLAAPNALGLKIAFDPYCWETCATRGVWRGGDGGGVACSGGGRFLNWLTLATSHVCTGDLFYDPLARRLLEIGTQRIRKK